MKVVSFFLVLGFVLNFALALIAVPPQPSEDEFYGEPYNIASFKEGDIMKWRKTPQKIRSLMYPINIKGAWQFMVRSTNSQGQPVGIVGTILQPHGADPSKVLVYNFAQDSADKNCAPSYSILFGAKKDTLQLQFESLYMNTALTRGWHVLVTDYEGLNAAFAAGKLAGMATLDAIRGTLNSRNTTGIVPEAKVAIWGFSGGTIPLSWAGALQPSYAPELSKNLIGVAVGGWVTNITLVVEHVEGTQYAGFIGVGILGLSSEYPEVQEKIFDLMDPLRIALVKSLYNQCVVGAISTFLGTNFFKGPSPIFKDGERLLHRPEIKRMMNENILAQNPSSPMPQVPFFVYHGEVDETIPFSNSQRVYDSWCSRGMGSMEFAVSQTSGHLTEFLEGGGAAIEWISRRFDGLEPVVGCSRTVRKSNLKYPGSNLGLSSVIRTTIVGVFQKQLGPLLRKSGSKSVIRTAIYNIITWLIRSIRLTLLKRDDVDEDFKLLLEY